MQIQLDNKESNIKKNITGRAKTSDKGISFKKVSKKGFLIIKKEENKCVFKVVFVRHG